MKNTKEALFHEYGQLLTSPRIRSQYEQFLKDTKQKPEEYEYGGITNACQISDNACEKNGRELLAEIFTLYKKGGTLDTKWKAFFNEKNIVKSKPIN